jgi:hypothetical protein
MIGALLGNRRRLLFAVLVYVSLSACGGPAEGPEEAIRSWVRQGHEAAEAKDRRALVDLISPAYTDARGNSRDDIENMFRLYFLRQQKVALISRIEELEVYGDTAAMLVLSVGMAGTNDNVLGFSADAYRFRMEFELQDDEWLLMSARWGQLGGDLH